MKKLVYAALLAAAAMLGTASASDPFASSSEPHGIVDLDIAQPAHQLFEAYFLEVDDQNVIATRKQLLLKPGKHKVKVGAILTDFAPGMSYSPRNAEPKNVVEIDVEAGMRYSVAAKTSGKYRGEWEAVVSRKASME